MEKLSAKDNTLLTDPIWDAFKKYGRIWEFVPSKVYPPTPTTTQDTIIWEKVADIRFEQLTDYTEDADIIIYFGEYS